MEDRQLVTKAVLECYPYIEDMYDALTRSAEKCALDGFYAVFAAEQMRLYEQILRYNDRKIGLYNMKYLIEEGIRRSGVMSDGFLRARYLLGKSAAEIASQKDTSLRTCYRQLQRGLEAFTSALERMGFDKKCLLKEFGNEPLFSSMLKRVIDEDDEMLRMKERLKGVNTEAFASFNRHNNHHSRPRRDSDGRAFA